MRPQYNYDMMLSSEVHDNSHYGYHFEVFSEHEHIVSDENADVKLICPSDGNGFLLTGGRMVDRSGRGISPLRPRIF